MKLLIKLFIIIFGLFIFAGIPYYFDANWLFFISWFPAMFIIMYLDNEVDEMKIS